MMDVSEIEELVAAWEVDVPTNKQCWQKGERPSLHSGHGPQCQIAAWSRETKAAREKLEKRGFSSPARASAYAKLLLAVEAVEKVECDDLIHFSLVDDLESCDPACIRCPVEAALAAHKEAGG